MRWLIMLGVVLSLMACKEFARDVGEATEDAAKSLGTATKRAAQGVGETSNKLVTPVLKSFQGTVKENTE